MSSISRYCLFVLCGAVFFVSAARVDLALRARSAWLEGEKYSAWAADPARKARDIEEIFSPRFKALDKELAAGRLSGPDFKDRKNLLRTEKNFRAGESAAKYAYIWYKTAARDFTPPATRWSALAGEKTPAALALWEKETGLRGK
jgi:hypothetical protein